MPVSGLLHSQTKHKSQVSEACRESSHKIQANPAFIEFGFSLLRIDERIRDFASIHNVPGDFVVSLRFKFLAISGKVRFDLSQPNKAMTVLQTTEPITIHKRMAIDPPPHCSLLIRQNPESTERRRYANAPNDRVYQLG